MKNGCYEEWLLRRKLVRKMVAKENGHKGKWSQRKLVLKEADRYEKCLL